METTALPARGIEPLHRAFRASVCPPGSKSETNRFYMLGALASGATRVLRPLRADDPDHFALGLTLTGCPVQLDEAGATILGSAGRPAGGVAVDMGDGGTPTRFFMALGALSRRGVVVDGSERMRQRPVDELARMLVALGADVSFTEAPGRLPVRVGARRVRGGSISVGATASSQFISAVLLAGPWMEDGVDIIFTQPPTSASYIELTIDALRRFGATVEVLRDGAGRLARITVPAAPLEGRTVTVEPDASSAVYFLAAAALIRDARCAVPGLPRATKQPDGAVVAALVAMGANDITVPGGTCVEGTGTLRGVDLDGSRWPDGALCVAAVAAAARGVTRIRGLQTLRVKESNRIVALAEELRKLGCTVQTTDSSIEIDPSTAHGRAVEIETHNDHRVAMSFAVLGLARPGITIANPGCVSKSYPGFWDDLASLRAGAST